MAKQYICDRCGVVRKSRATIVSRALWFPTEMSGIGRAWWHDLCSDCNRDLDLFLRNQPTATRESDLGG